MRNPPDGNWAHTPPTATDRTHLGKCAIKKLLTALMSLVFVRVVEAIIITITDIDTRNTVSIIACEQITKACPTFRLAVLWWFI
jgi:hypothetical protein